MDRIDNIKLRFLSNVPYIECGTGWDDILRNLDEKLEQIDPDYKIHQIKEKFGTLHFYAECSDSIDPTGICLFDRYIQEVKSESKHTCEMCGCHRVIEQPKGVYWIKILCLDCWIARIKSRPKRIEKTIDLLTKLRNANADER